MQTDVLHLAILILLSIAETGSRSDHVTCPPKCYCQPSARIVQCARRGLVSIPEVVPETTRQINLNGNHFRFGSIGRANFTRYPGLRRKAGNNPQVGVEQLYLSDCAIRHIEPGAFSDLVDLRWLDLSDNLLETISDSTFTGSNLEQLFLNGNRRLVLVPTSFAGLSTSGLYLHDCGLEQLDAASLSPLVGSLRTLWLQKNRIQQLDQVMSHIIESLTDFRFVPNPYHCDCRLSWFKRLFDRRRLHVLHDSTSNSREAPSHTNGFDANPFCSGPPSLSGRSFAELTLNDFHCRLPVFGDIEADFDGKSGRLVCTARGEPQPEVRWIHWPTADSQSSSAVTAMTEVVHVAKSDGVSVAAELILSDRHQLDGNDFVTTTRQMSDDIFSCIASNAAGNITLTVSLQSDAKSSSHSMASPTFGLLNSTIFSTSPTRSDGGEYGDQRRHILHNNINNTSSSRRSKSTFGRNDVIVERDAADEVVAIKNRPIAPLARFPNKASVTGLPRPEVSLRYSRRFVFGELVLAVIVTAVITMATVFVATWLVLLTHSCLQRRHRNVTGQPTGTCTEQRTAA